MEAAPSDWVVDLAAQAVHSVRFCRERRREGGGDKGRETEEHRQGWGVGRGAQGERMFGGGGRSVQGDYGRMLGYDGAS
jgi:hypothetical protein